MTSAQIAAGLAALAVAMWPQVKAAGISTVGWFLANRVKPAPSPVPEVQETPTYAAAIADLANVRARLKATDALKDEQLKAIDVLTLALVAGSDQ